MMKSRCFIPDRIENGETKRWCKECEKFLCIDMFHTRTCGFRQLLCKTHIAARQRGIYRIRADVLASCTRIGVKFALTVDDLRIIEEFHDMELYRPIPRDPTKPLTLENTCIVTLAARKTLMSFIIRGKDAKYYRAMVQKAAKEVIDDKNDQKPESDVEVMAP
jgi:hypothetical protein